jgi:hypothetical protein
VKSLFLEGLESARELVQNKGVAQLDRLIEELKLAQPETTSVTIDAEKR